MLVEIDVGGKLKRFREMMNMSVEMLASTSGVPEQLINDIENHRISPPLGTLTRLAKALNIKVGRFFEEGPRKAYSIIRKDEGGFMSKFQGKNMENMGVQYLSLGFEKRERLIEPFLVTLTEESRTHSKVSLTHPGEEFIYVIEGDIEFEIMGKTEILHRGDSAYFDSSMPHAIKLASGKMAVYLAIFADK
jgi:transcriptional regulator with XRE-family HTH domain